MRTTRHLLLYLFVFVSPCVAAPPYEQLARSLADVAPIAVTNIIVGNFLYGDTELMTQFSSLAREEMETQMGIGGRFKVITRSRLADFKAESLMFDSGLLDPGSNAENSKPEAAQAIVRGRFYYNYPKVTIFAELALMGSKEVKKAKIEIAVQDAGARIWPDAQTTEGKANAVLKPQNEEKSLANVNDITTRVKKVPHDFDVTLSATQGKRDFAEGETISYRIESVKSCHIAVFCHQIDGSTVVLFPNPWNKDTKIMAGKPVDIPGTSKSGFEILIGPPFGADVVQVIACTKFSALHKTVADIVARGASEGGAYRGMTRGMYTQGVEASLGEEYSDDSGPAEWSEAHIVLCTYPK